MPKILFEEGNKQATGGARPGSGRKPDAFKQMLDTAFRNVVSQRAMNKVVDKLLTQAKEGDVRAIGLLMDRMVGKVPQPVTGEDGGALVIRVEYVGKQEGEG